MEWQIGLLIYLGVGVVFFGILWKLFNINWQMEANDMKIMMVLIPFLWPLILVFIIGVKTWAWLGH